MIVQKCISGNWTPQSHTSCVEKIILVLASTHNGTYNMEGLVTSLGLEQWIELTTHQWLTLEELCEIQVTIQGGQLQAIPCKFWANFYN